MHSLRNQRDPDAVLNLVVLLASKMQLLNLVGMPTRFLVIVDPAAVQAKVSYWVLESTYLQVLNLLVKYFQVVLTS